MAKVELRVKGMHCSACVTRVTRALNQVPGVVSCKVDLLDQRARVEWAAGEPDVPTLKEAVRGIGFKVED